MQDRHLNRKRYFDELAITSQKYFVPYVKQFIKITKETRILEIGCGDGGNLLPFAEKGCEVTGVDFSETRIEQAKSFFTENKQQANLIASDIFKIKSFQQKFDLILVHDVIEHISAKKEFFKNIKKFMAPRGIIFFGFPAWQMPFGGHQQICKSKIVSHWPFLHLFPNFVYRTILKACKESNAAVKELLDIKSCKISIEMFEKLVKENNYRIIDRKLFLINPHYEIKFHLHPQKLSPIFANIPYFRNFLSTSCFFIINQNN